MALLEAGRVLAQQSEPGLEVSALQTHAALFHPLLPHSAAMGTGEAGNLNLPFIGVHDDNENWFMERHRPLPSPPGGVGNGGGVVAPVGDELRRLVQVEEHLVLPGLELPDFLLVALGPRLG